MVSREKELETFNKLKPEERISYGVNAEILINENLLTLKYMREGGVNNGDKDDKGDRETEEESNIEDNNKAKEIKLIEGRFNTKEEALNLINSLTSNQFALLKNIEIKQVQSAPPKPFTTSKLLKAGSKELNISTKEVQDLAQKLFEAGLITYIRTDSEFISKEYLEEHKNFYQGIYPDFYEYKEYSAGKNSQAEAHEAIRITHPHKFEDLIDVCKKEKITTDNAIALYRTIFINTIVSQSKNAVYENISLHFKIKMSDFKVSMNNLIYEGYLKLLEEFNAGNKKSHTSRSENDLNNTDSDHQERDSKQKPKAFDSSKLKEGELYPLKTLKLRETPKSPPKRFLESDFIEVLEKKGIGRPSTYASYLPILLNKEYINIDGKKREISPSIKGINVIDFFHNDSNSWILDLNFTKDMEKKLDLITEKKESYIAFMQEINSKLNGVSFQSYVKSSETKKEKKLIPASTKQIEFCKAIAEKLKISLPKNLEIDCYVAKDFIDKHIKAFNAKKYREKEESEKENTGGAK
nr:DNA topoisomerase [Helicobacter sp. 12S02232-10]